MWADNEQPLFSGLWGFVLTFSEMTQLEVPTHNSLPIFSYNSLSLYPASALYDVTKGTDTSPKWVTVSRDVLVCVWELLSAGCCKHRAKISCFLRLDRYIWGSNDAQPLRWSLLGQKVRAKNGSKTGRLTPPLRLCPLAEWRKIWLVCATTWRATVNCVSTQHAWSTRQEFGLIFLKRPFLHLGCSNSVLHIQKPSSLLFLLGHTAAADVLKWDMHQPICWASCDSEDWGEHLQSPRVHQHSSALPGWWMTPNPKGFDICIWSLATWN